ncbi:MAG: hpaI [Rhodoferax sp.]|nr:hpaI [Rhodoferax sp.]
MTSNRLKLRSRAGEKSTGLWLQSTDPAFAEMAAILGFDFVIIDHEHGPGSLADGIALMRATMAGTQTTAVVRVPSADPAYLKRIIDAGAEGVLIPMVDTADDARAAVAACRYPPQGMRGNAAMAVRASGYGLREGYVAGANEALMVILQLESRTAMHNARAIAAVDGVDMLFIGPVDLACTMGAPDTNAPEVNALIDRCLEEMRAVDMPLGTTPRLGHPGPQLLDQGFALVTVGSDIAFFRTAAQAALQPRPADRSDGAMPSRTY